MLSSIAKWRLALLVDETMYANLPQSTAKWKLVVLVDETGYANLQQITNKWRLVLLVDETGVHKYAAKHCQVAASFIGR